MHHVVSASRVYSVHYLIATCCFSPTELDALVFGHVFTLLTTSLPEGRFAEIVQKFPNLTSFCQRIDEKYFKQN